MDQVFKQKLVPVQFQTKVTVPDTTNKTEALALVRAMQEDKSITAVRIVGKESDPVVSQALADLFQSDDREWEEDVMMSESGRFD